MLTSFSTSLFFFRMQKTVYLSSTVTSTADEALLLQYALTNLGCSCQGSVSLTSVLEESLEQILLESVLGHMEERKVI